ncbi:MAG: PEP-CTERM sorting domain-containing protein [Luteolibacter sp.]
MGHFYRTETLEAGETYQVSLWRMIDVETMGTRTLGFSAWNSNGLEIYQPFQNTPGNLLVYQPYDLDEGGWQHVQFTFTAPGQIGDGPSSVTFMMGIYTPDDSISIGEIPVVDADGNVRTLDPPAPTTGDTGSVTQNSSYAIDGFSVVQVPEPSSLLLTGLGVGFAFTRRNRPQSVHNR